MPPGFIASSDAESRHVQRVYLILMLLHTLAASFIWGINTLFLLDAGLSNAEAFSANAFFTAGQVIFEVPTGVTGSRPAARPLSAREKELSTMVPSIAVTLQQYLDHRSEVKRPTALHGLMAYEVMNFVDGTNSYLDVGGGTNASRFYRLLGR